VPITVLADGTAIAIITPYSAFWGDYQQSQYLPFCVVSSGSTTNPFAAATPNYGATGPMYSQVSNVSTFQVDSCTIDFIET
jgi:hypothetical protein